MSKPTIIGDATLYCGNCLDILPTLGKVETVITDPVWPNSVFPSVVDPYRLFAEAAALFDADRIVVHLGCASDPRFLSGIPERFPFLRTCWLRYAQPSYRGRILMGSDVAYIYGDAPPARPGKTLLSGETCASKNSTKGQYTGRGTGSSKEIDYGALPHPAPRRTEHVEWLVDRFSVDFVLDPFMGTGTTGAMCAKLGRQFIGIEIEPAYFDIACQRIEESYAQPDFFVEPPPAKPVQETLDVHGSGRREGA